MKKNKQKKQTEDTFNTLIRKGAHRTLKKFIEKDANKFTQEELLEASSKIIDSIYSFEGLDYLQECDKRKVAEIIEALSDSILSYSINNSHSGFTIIRDKLIKKIKSDNSRINELLLLCSNELFASLLEEHNETIEFNVGKLEYTPFKAILANVSTFSLYILTFVINLKNQNIVGLAKQKEKIVFKYSNGKILNQEQVDNLKSNLESGNLHPSQILYIIMSITYLVSNYNYGLEDTNKQTNLNTDIFSIYFDGINDEFVHFLNENADINPDFLVGILDHRKYGIFPNGIKFDFKNKDIGIDTIEMHENQDKIKYSVSFRNNKNMKYLSKIDNINFLEKSLFYSKEKREKEILKYLKPIKDIDLYFTINKEDIKNSHDFKDLITKVETNGININKELSDSIYTYVSLIYTLLLCSYIATNDLKYGQKFFSIKEIEDKNTSLLKTKKESGYRVSHLRKLPTGYKNSKEALAAAKKAGFDKIPDGYTFVDEHIPANVPQRIIKL